MSDNTSGKILVSEAIKAIKNFTKNVIPKIWEKIVKWFIKSIKQDLKNNNIEGFKYFVKNAGKVFVDIIRKYFLEGQQWYVKEVIRKVPENDVPPDIVAKAKAKRKEAEIDATSELKEQLELQFF